MDKFGENVYRASFRLTDKGNPQMMFMLLVVKDDRLLWAGRN